MAATVSPQDVEYFGRNYDELGVGSAKVSNYLPNAIIVCELVFHLQAQQLNTPISSLCKLLEAPSHTVLYFSNPTGTTSTPIGFIRYGLKDLFFYTKEGKVIEAKKTNCVLDFYVVESAQRQGVGIKLFKRMLEVRHSMYL